MSHASTLDSADYDAERLTQIARELRNNVLAGKFKIPMLPVSAATLLKLSADPSVSVKDLEAAVIQEPMIAAKVVGAANSSLYAGRGGVTSLHQAAIRLGCAVIRDLIGQAIADAWIFSGPGQQLLTVQRQHAFAVATLSRQICRMRQSDSEHAFLCGLFHDLGQPVLFQMMKSNELTYGLKEAQLRVLAELLHPIVGERVARAWELPESVAEVARFHHCFRGTDHNPLVHVVALADHFAYHIGIGDREMSTELDRDPIWAELGMPVEQVDDLKHFADKHLKNNDSN